MRRIKKLMMLLLCTIILTSLLPMEVSADMGPKPTVVIEIEGLTDEIYYGTLLSESRSNGPLDAMDETELMDKQDDEDYGVWKAFVEYEDSDGYYFLPELDECMGTDEFTWDYYPPSPFKVLLYFPEYDTFVASGIYEEYAFDSYFTIELTGIDVKNAVDVIKVSAEESYEYGKEIMALCVRIVLTILIELGIAYLAGYHEKRQLQFFGIVNVVTQVLLNVYLYFLDYHSGAGLTFTLHYITLEFIIFAIEAFWYMWVLPDISKTPVKRWALVVFALFANGYSFLAGIFLAEILPVFF